MAGFCPAAKHGFAPCIVSDGWGVFVFKDFREFENDASIDADLCIIGAGAAGISMARRLAGGKRRVLLVESGDVTPDIAVQALFEGDVVGQPWEPLDIGRLRFFGGSTNHWGGHCRPLDPIDFEARPWVPYSGWPITKADLDPYYVEAQKVVELGPYEYDPEKFDDLKEKILPFNPERLRQRMWQDSPPTNFAIAYGDELKEAPTVEVLLNANVMEIVAAENGAAIEAVRIRTLEGKQGTIRPRTVVLACGGIENVRILLVSDGVHKNGLGNDHDLVGRFFADHPHALCAMGVPMIDIHKLDAYFSDFTSLDGLGIYIKPGIPVELQRKLQILNGAFDVGYGYDRASGFLALRDIGKALFAKRLLPDFGAAVMRVVSDLDGTAEGLYRYLRKEDVFWFAANFEQTPNPDSRITLGDKRDALGMRRLVLNWQFSALDKLSVRAGLKILGEELARLKVARLRIDDWITADETTWLDVNDRAHPMGTTRMADDPKYGVVDRDCRVHGIANLYIAGSSVFPTSGYANPTLTIVALALRLAAHLDEDNHA